MTNEIADKVYVMPKPRGVISSLSEDEKEILFRQWQEKQEERERNENALKFSNGKQYPVPGTTDRSIISTLEQMLADADVFGLEIQANSDGSHTEQAKAEGNYTNFPFPYPRTSEQPHNRVMLLDYYEQKVFVKKAIEHWLKSKILMPLRNILATIQATTRIEFIDNPINGVDGISNAPQILEQTCNLRSEVLTEAICVAHQQERIMLQGKKE